MTNLTEGNGVLVAGHACYELGEVHRLLGQDDAAELAYRRATSSERASSPGWPCCDSGKATRPPQPMGSIAP